MLQTGAQPGLWVARTGCPYRYGNLLVLDQRKCLLLTHADTLFTIFEPDVRAPELRSTHDLVAGLIERELLAEELPIHVLGDLEAEELSIAKTVDRSVLGCMNDMAYLCEDAVARTGSPASADVSSLNRHLRRNINSAGLPMANRPRP